MIPLSSSIRMGRDVSVAPEMRAAVSYGNTHSLQFRTQYERLRGDHKVLWIIHSEMRTNVGTRAHSDHLILDRDPNTHQILHAGQISHIPFVGEREEAILIGHEGKHLEQTLDTGHSIVERVRSHDPDLYETPGAARGSYESRQVLAFEALIRLDIESNEQLFLPVGREIVRNMIDLTPAQK
jgi:hypothetical protein